MQSVIKAQADNRNLSSGQMSRFGI